MRKFYRHLLSIVACLVAAPVASTVLAAGFAPVAPIKTNAADRLYCPLTVYAKFRF